MSKQAEKFLKTLLDSEERVGWERAVKEVQRTCDVQEQTAETYIRRADTATTEVTPEGDKVVVDPAEAAGNTVLTNEDELEIEAGDPTSQRFGELTVLEDVNHPQVPTKHEEGYFRRKVTDTQTDVRVVTATMDDEDFSTLLEGEAGVGKDKLVLHICANTNRPVIRPTFTGDGDLVDLLIGTYAPSEDGGFEFKKGLLTVAVEHGYTFIADEVNMISGRLQTQMNDILEDADQAQLTIPETNEVIEPHPEFKFVGTMNPPKVGYSDTQPLNTAFQSRFFPIEIPPLEEDAEKRVVAQNTEWDDDDYKLDVLLRSNGGVVPGIRSLYETGKIGTWVSTRHVIQIGRMAEKLGNVREAAELILTGHANPEDEDPIRSAINDQNW